jgi:hypothetical protein
MPLQGEYHSNNQTMAKLLHKAVGLGDESKASQEAYKAYMQHFVDSPVAVLRDCLEFKAGRCGAICSCYDQLCWWCCLSVLLLCIMGGLRGCLEFKAGRCAVWRTDDDGRVDIFLRRWCGPRRGNRVLWL